MEESILLSIKKLLGVAPEYEAFDQDIIIHINSVLMILNQLGFGPVGGFRVEDDVATWIQYLGEDNTNIEAVKSYVHLKVKLIFDPPLNASVLESMKQTITELEWRLNIQDKVEAAMAAEAISKEEIDAMFNS